MSPAASCSWSFPIVVLSCLVAKPSSAQEPIEEIIVVADHRGRTMAELPSAISLLDQEAVSGLAVQHFEELIGVLPNMNWSGDGHRARYLQIRGVGELAQYQGAPNPSVGFIIDDIDFSGIGTIATLFDIDRIEVLRGPQGTRYGANALAGLVYMQSAEPDSDLSGKLKLTAGGDDAIGGGIAVGGPVGRGGYRFSAHHYESNGFRDNPYLGRDDSNGRDETSVRGKLAWDAGKDWTFRLAGLYARIDNGYDAFAIDNSLTVLSDKPGRDAQQSVGASFRADWAGASTFSITSITAVADTDIEFSFDADWGNDDAWNPVLYDYISRSDRTRGTVSQELRLTSTEEGRIFNGNSAWLLGIYANQMDEDLVTVNRGEYYDPGYDFADSLDASVASRFEATNVAMFGQLDIDASENGTWTIGARIERRTTDYADTDGLDLGPSETMFGGRLAYTHQISEDLSAFISLTRGYKAGGFNLGFVPEGRRSFDEESVVNLESGLRTRLVGGQMLFSGSIFYSRRQDQQVETSFQLNPNDPASFVFFTDNAAKGRTLGIEAEVQWFAMEGMQFYANVGLLNAEFDEFVTPQIDISGRDQAHAPAYTLALGGIFSHSSGWFGRVDISARDAFYFDTSHDQRSEAYALTNLRLGYAAERWSAELWVRNAFDERYAVRGFYFGNEPPDFVPALYIRQGDPRQVGITFDWRF